MKRSKRTPTYHGLKRCAHNSKLLRDARWPDLTGACAPEPATERRAQSRKQRVGEEQSRERTRKDDQQKKKNNGQCARKPWTMMARRVQNGGKMAPKWLPGGLWATLGRRLCFQRLPGALLEGLWGGPGVPKNSLLAPWGPPGAKSWSISCLRGVPGRPSEGPGEAPGGHFGGIFAAGPCGTKKVRKFT